MIVNDMVSDTLARLQNATARDAVEVSVLKSKLIKSLLDVLLEEDFIAGYEEVDGMYKVSLIDSPTAPRHFTRVSKPGQRIYVQAKDIVPVMNGRGVGIISTSAGVMSSARAKSQGIGGEYLCKIW